MPLLPSRFLFRFAAPCLYCGQLGKQPLPALSPQYRLVNLAALEGGPSWADVRAAWSEAGLMLSVEVRGKQQPIWCRGSRPEDSDGAQFWIDTRDVHNVHRASRFCHSFLALPGGGGSRQGRPMAQMVPINRARDLPRPIKPELLIVRSQIRRDGYAVELWLPADALTGFEPQEHPRLGFTYAATDRELGQQTFSVGSPLPFQEDPSLWATLELTRA